ncbi:MAG: DEAD/DEAH box helicase, partial [Planctomycetaceae bacterium]|nr:DEAD/DEAH box helicase [Planctomycetaceae bacterium]
MLSSAPSVCFAALNLADSVKAAVARKGYETPTPIQAAAIPHLLEGRDVLGQASTGTGKTAAFALPLLSRIDVHERNTQVLVLTPTRELAIQVAASFTDYGSQMPHLNVLAVYGGASYVTQIRQLKRGAQIVVGTPGRVMDHMRSGVLDLSALRCLVLDEADEMLRMGFVDDVRWVLEHTPDQHQCALFSATMPDPIRKIADEHLEDPAVVTIRQETSVAAGIRARCLFVPHREKTHALIRILESEQTDGVIVFVKTRETTLRVAEALQERGFSATALNGDIPQRQREQTIQQLKSGMLNILVATDVAARGLDVHRISHVINYDMPHDSEAWIHRIGRTGRAGRQGEAILLLPRHERRRLQYLERETGQAIREMPYPSVAAVNARRIENFRQRLVDSLTSPQLPAYRRLITDLQEQTDATVQDLAAAAALLVNNGMPLLLPEEKRFNDRRDRHNESSAPGRTERPRTGHDPRAKHDQRSKHDHRRPGHNERSFENQPQPPRRHEPVDQPAAITSGQAENIPPTDQHSVATHSVATHSAATHSAATHSAATHSAATHSAAAHSDAAHSDAARSDAAHSNVAHSKSEHGKSEHSDGQHYPTEVIHVPAHNAERIPETRRPERERVDHAGRAARGANGRPDRRGQREEHFVNHTDRNREDGKRPASRRR